MSSNPTLLDAAGSPQRNVGSPSSPVPVPGAVGSGSIVMSGVVPRTLSASMGGIVLADELAAAPLPRNTAGRRGSDDAEVTPITILGEVAASDRGSASGVGTAAGAGAGVGAGAAASAPAARGQPAPATLPTRQELMGIRTRVRLYEVLDGRCTVDDPPCVFLGRAAWNLLQMKTIVIIIACTMVPIIWFHQHMHVTYLEELETYTNVTTTERHGMLGHAGMFDASRPLFWLWTMTFWLFGSLNFLCVSVVWLYVITGYQPLTTPMRWMTAFIVSFFALYIFGGYLLVGYADVAIMQLIYNAPAFLSAAVISWLCGRLYVDEVGMKKLPLVLCIQVLVNASVFYVYTEWIPAWFLSTNSDFGRLLIRVIVHPILVECIVGTMRVASLMYPAELDQSSLVIFLFPAYIVSNLLGRFLVATSSTFTWALVTTICISAQEIAMRMTMWQRDYFYLKCFIGPERAEALAYSKRSRRLKADILSLDAITEDLGIVVAPVILYFYQLAATEEEIGTFIEIGPLFLTMLMQFTIEIATDLAPSIFVVIVDNPAYLSASYLINKARKARRRRQLKAAVAKHKGTAMEADVEHKAAAPRRVLPTAEPEPSGRQKRSTRGDFLDAMRRRSSAPGLPRAVVEAQPSPAPPGFVASARLAEEEGRLPAYGAGTAAVTGVAPYSAMFPSSRTLPPLVKLPDKMARRWRKAHKRMVMLRHVNAGPFATPSDPEECKGDGVSNAEAQVDFTSNNADADRAQLANFVTRLDMCKTKRERVRELAYQKNKLAWVSVGRNRVDGGILIHRAASDNEIETMNPTVAERVFKWLQLAEPITYVTKIKRSHVNTINAWTTTFTGYGLVFWLYYIIWGEYFLRFYLFPTAVTCATHRNDGVWPEWQFHTCRNLGF